MRALGRSGALRASLGSQHIEPLTATSAQNWSPLYRTRGYGYLDARDPRAVRRGRGAEVVFAEDTRYHRLAVVDDADTRYLRFDNSLQSAMYLGRPVPDALPLHRLLPPRHRVQPGRARRALRRSRRRLVGEAAVARLPAAPDRRRSSSIPSSSTSRTATSRCRATRGCASRSATGAASSPASERRWDVIVIDAFFADAIPAHLVTQEFLELARTRLAPGGVVVTNAIGAHRRDRAHASSARSTRPTARRSRPCSSTRRSCPAIGRRAVPEPDPGRDGEGGAPAAASSPTAGTSSAGRRRACPISRKPILDRRDGEIPTDDVPVLTDDYAPTDALLLLFQ